MQLESLEKRQAARNEINWVTAIFMTAFHVGAIAALFFFTWKALCVALFLWWVSGSLGIGMGYHRLLTHRGYKTPKWMEYLLTICATLTLEGGPIFWVATHRQHHQNPDTEGDPPPPNDAGLPPGPRLREDKIPGWISKWHWIPITTLGLLLLVFGGWPYMFWGIFFR